MSTDRQTATQIISGKAIATELRLAIKEQTEQLKKQGVSPGLAVILIGEDPASQVYVRNKGVQAKEVGFNSFEYKLPVETNQAELLALISELNHRQDVHGILVQLPLPKQIEEKAVINAIDPQKDVDGFTLTNVGKLSTGEQTLTPCTPLGCIKLLQHQLGDTLSGKHAVVIGRSNIVGKPVAMLLLQNNCTITIVHSRTKNIEEICKQADILIVAIGSPKLVTRSWVKPGAVVIDVGINRITVIDEQGESKTKLVGDVDFEDVSPITEAITPVPGGVGPMTIACLLDNTLTAAKMQVKLKQTEQES